MTSSALTLRLKPAFFAALALTSASGALPAVQAIKDEAPIELLGTRVIFNESDHSASVRIRNRSRNALLASVSISPFAGVGKSAPTCDDFMASPSLRILHPGETYPFRIVRLQENLPDDRESLYIINIRIVPSEHEMSSPVRARAPEVVVTFSGSMKLFWRPKALEHAFGVEEFKATLRASCANGQLLLSNPSGYWGTFASVRVGEQELADSTFMPMVPPHSSIGFPVAACPREAVVSLMSENGQATPDQIVRIEASRGEEHR